MSSVEKRLGRSLALPILNVVAKKRMLLVKPAVRKKGIPVLPGFPLSIAVGEILPKLALLAVLCSVTLAAESLSCGA